jgi:hypothetical protein
VIGEAISAQACGVDQPFVPVSNRLAATLICRELSAAAVSILSSPRRTRDDVQREYDGGYWTAVLHQRRWESCKTLEEFLNPGGNGWRVCKIDNRLVRARNSDYYRYRHLRLRRILEQYAGHDTDLIEIGSGYGANLFALSSSARWHRLIGLELSETGLAAGRSIAEHFGLSDRIRFEPADLTKLSASARQLLKGRVAFSYYAFEQIPHDTESAIYNLIEAGVSRIVHVEPIAELLRWYLPKDLLNYAHIIRHDYQRTLLRTLRRLETLGKLRVTTVERLYYAPGIRHDPALVVWEPVRDAGSPRRREG